MATDIEWADETWNPVVGCTRVSAGCDHCYAIGVAARELQAAHAGLTKIRPKGSSRPGPDWNGTVRTLPDRLSDPLTWRKPKRIFVCSMADLHHDAVPMEFRAAVYGVALACSSLHTFLVLTKRDPRPFYAWVEREAKTKTIRALCRDAKRANYGRGLWDPRVRVCVEAAERMGAISGYLASATACEDVWPPRNLHLGVSVESRAWLHRLDWLLECPARVHWASFEPLLEDLGDVSRWVYDSPTRTGHPPDGANVLRWAVIGGESGRGARPTSIPAIRNLIAQLRWRARVFVKQLGSRPMEAYPGEGGLERVHLASSKGGDTSEWTRERGLADLAIRELPR